MIRILFLLLTLILPISCYYSHPTNDQWVNANKESIDSVNFYIQHHYWTGYNFQTTDSLHLVATPPLMGTSDYHPRTSDSIGVGGRDVLVVARLLSVPTDTIDSIWVKLARDQYTQGWVRESDLLKHVVPKDPISKFIYHFSDKRTLYFLSLFGLALLFGLIQIFRHKQYRLVHFRDIPSFYPTLLCLSVSISATLYGTMQRFAPETWVEFYFHPTLNPLHPDLPLVLALFIASVWGMLIVAVAVVDEVRRQPDLGDTLTYLASLGGVCVVLYLVFTLTTPYYIGYVLLPLYWRFAIRRYLQHEPSHLLCGVCNQPIPKKGKCPHCGAINE